MRRFLPLAAGLLLALWPAGGPAGSPASAQTSIDFDGATDFSRYKTYGWGQNTSSGNPVADEHIVTWIEGQLAAAGWTKVTAGEAQVILAEHATVKNDTTVDTFYSVGSYGVIDRDDNCTGFEMQLPPEVEPGSAFFLFSVYRDVVAAAPELAAEQLRERSVGKLRLLQAGDVRPPLIQPGQEARESLLDRVDVPGRDSHGG